MSEGCGQAPVDAPSLALPSTLTYTSSPHSNTDPDDTACRPPDARTTWHTSTHTMWLVNHDRGSTRPVHPIQSRSWGRLSGDVP